MRAIQSSNISDVPEIELIEGSEVPKMSPRRTHARLQGVMWAIIESWATGRGEVGTEWRFALERSRERETSLVPDVSFVSAERLASLSDDDVEEPPFAPDIAIEIRSPGDRESNIKRKVERYLACGGRIVLDVRPESRTIVAHDATGAREFAADDIFEHAQCPQLTFSVANYFAEADRKKPS